MERSRKSNWSKQGVWGVTETNHRVDIINQTDFTEGFDGEEKLGQPMIKISFERPWGLLDVYALLGFRERNFSGTKGRLRLPLSINEKNSLLFIIIKK